MQMGALVYILMMDSSISPSIKSIGTSTTPTYGRNPHKLRQLNSPSRLRQLQRQLKERDLPHPSSSRPLHTCPFLRQTP